MDKPGAAEAREESALESLTLRQLLIKVYGKVSRIEGQIGNGGGILQDIRNLRDALKHCVTRAELTLIIAVVSAVLAGFVLLLKFAL